MDLNRDNEYIDVTLDISEVYDEEYSEPGGSGGAKGCSPAHAG